VSVMCDQAFDVKNYIASIAYFKTSKSCGLDKE
jgi:hypothetical protein